MIQLVAIRGYYVVKPENSQRSTNRMVRNVGKMRCNSGVVLFSCVKTFNRLIPVNRLVFGWFWG